jgi:tape measure domain-containing protein
MNDIQVLIGADDAEFQRVIGNIEQRSAAAGERTRDNLDTAIVFAKIAAGARAAEAAYSLFVDTADRMKVANSRIKSITSDTNELTAIQDVLYHQAQVIGMSYEENVEIFARYYRGLKEHGYTANETAIAVDALNKSVRVSGATSAEAASFMLQFKQGLLSGKLAGEEFKAMLESNSYFAQKLADALGVPIGSLYKMREEGKLTTKLLMDAIAKMAESISADFEKLEKPVEAAKVRLSNAFAKIISDADNAGGNTKAFSESISDLAAVVESNAPAIREFFSAIITASGVAIKGVHALWAEVNRTAGVFSVAYGAVAAGVGSMAGKLTDAIGITEDAGNDVLRHGEAAMASGLDLLNKSADAYKTILGESAANYVDSEKKKLKAANETLAAIKQTDEGLAKRAASAARAAESEAKSAAKAAAAVEAAAKRKAAAEATAQQKIEKLITETFQKTGMLGEQYAEIRQREIDDELGKYVELGADRIAAETNAYTQLIALRDELEQRGYVTLAASMDKSAGLYKNFATESIQSINGIISAEQRLADAHAAAMDEMFEKTGAGGEEYMARKVAEIQRMADEYIKLGGERARIEQWVHDEIVKLQADAAQKGLTTLASQLGQQAAMYGTYVESASSSMNQVAAASDMATQSVNVTGEALSRLDGAVAQAGVNVDITSAMSNIDTVNKALDATESRGGSLLSRQMGSYGQVGYSDAELLSSSVHLDPFGSVQQRVDAASMKNQKPYSWDDVFRGFHDAMFGVQKTTKAMDGAANSWRSQMSGISSSAASMAGNVNMSLGGAVETMGDFYKNQQQFIPEFESAFQAGNRTQEKDESIYAHSRMTEWKAKMLGIPFAEAANMASSVGVPRLSVMPPTQQAAQLSSQAPKTGDNEQIELLRQIKDKLNQTNTTITNTFTRSYTIQDIAEITKKQSQLFNIVK